MRTEIHFVLLLKSIFPGFFFLFSFLVVLGLHCGARASHCGGFSCCGVRALGAWAQELWRTDLVAPQHVGPSQTKDRTRVPCTGRRILNHCATREVPTGFLKELHCQEISMELDP